MHELGLSIRLTLNPDTENERILLDIPDWDFQWQFNYHPIESIILKDGDIIRVDCADVPQLSDTSYGLWGPVMKCATPASQHRHPTTPAN